MNNLVQEVLIFRTNVDTPTAIRKLAPLLNGHLFISKWNFDLEDCDKILRIETAAKISEEIIKILRSKGFDCEELI
jgi:hypothetical protein